MRTKVLYLSVQVILTMSVFCQSKQLGLAKGNISLFKNTLYAYGFLSKEKKPVFCIYKLNKQLNVTDSMLIVLGKSATDSYLNISSDTLHDCLNIYLQKKEKKLVNILRFDKDLHVIANIDNVDIARLNSISDFENEVFYLKDEVFTIKYQKDSSGTQFYLNKYTVKSKTKNFEYEFTWQFPFERKNINSAHIFYADKKVIKLYVNVSGDKPGQWILNINTQTGKLIRGIKLNDKGAKDFYQFGNFINDTMKHSLSLVGQKFTAAQFSQAENKFYISNLPNALVYYIEIDSLLEISEKQEFKIPIAEQAAATKKTGNNYILRVNNLAKNRAGDVSFECDIFKNTNNTLNFWYTNTNLYKLVQPEGELVLEKNTVTTNRQIESYYISNDKLDVNGKLFVDSLKHLEKLFYKNVTFPVRKEFKTDVNGNGMWILSRSVSKTNVINFSYLAPVKNSYQVTLIEELPTSTNPVFIPLSKNLFLIGRQTEENNYEIKAQNW